MPADAGLCDCDYICCFLFCLVVRKLTHQNRRHCSDDNGGGGSDSSSSDGAGDAAAKGSRAGVIDAAERLRSADVLRVLSTRKDKDARRAVKRWGTGRK
jgi:hypothetical protein